MGFREALRNAEQQGRAAAQDGLERARDGWEDVERRLRRKMRIFPASFRRTRPNTTYDAGQNRKVETTEETPPAANARKHAA